MNAPEHRKRNLRLGIILSLVFVVLFIVATRIIVTGSKVPPAVEGAIENIKAPVLWFIGFFLLIVAIIEIGFWIVKGRVRENGNSE